MNFFVPGVLTGLKNVPAGACFMFKFENTTRIGVMIIDGHGRMGILDFEQVNKEGKSYPYIYLLEDFYNEDVLYFETARIIPTIKPDIAKFGYYGDGMPSKALYISGESAVILAVSKQRMMKFDLITGRATQGDVAYYMHTTEWRIEVLNQYGDYEMLVEVSA